MEYFFRLIFSTASTKNWILLECFYRSTVPKWDECLLVYRLKRPTKILQIKSWFFFAPPALVGLVTTFSGIVLRDIFIQESISRTFRKENIWHWCHKPLNLKYPTLLGFLFEGTPHLPLDPFIITPLHNKEWKYPTSKTKLRVYVWLKWFSIPG